MLDHIGDKWAILVIRMLSDGPLRFSELKRDIGSVSQKMLTSTLRNLERDGFVTRHVTPSIPPRVDYELTAMGRDVMVPLNALAEWALRNRARVERSRRSFDTKRARATKE
ncbi:Transcriptional regulator, HxlR family protein [Sandaracinus amylolyticus]|uniref:Transcriptional regulator, HxlR family protein n=1 Tax=Sandaracinus amylolyticus TaxID=927083 RepID=A0A0F6W0X5_9BACT|nr:Transcriptional regulator, HxlR family protein [Sandaracinus amylolyticus]